MNRIKITMNIPDEIADPFHKMGVTSEGYEEIMELLVGIGEDVEIERANDE